MAASSRRALHFVFKVADRTSTAVFYRDVLGMKVTKPQELPRLTCNHALLKYIHRSFVMRSLKRAARHPAMG